MTKHIYLLGGVVLIFAALLSACGSGDLAKDLTPVPTLRPGQTPTLVAALSGQAAATEEASAQTEGTAEVGTDATEAAGAATEEVGTEATAEAGGTEEANAGAEGDPAAGEELFASTCSGCHGDQNGAGPARIGIGERAATRVDGLSAAEYIHQSIVDPSAYVVEGFSDIMPKNYDEQFDDEQLNNLVAYLLTQ